MNEDQFTPEERIHRIEDRSAAIEHQIQQETLGLSELGALADEVKRMLAEVDGLPVNNGGVQAEHLSNIRSRLVQLFNSISLMRATHPANSTARQAVVADLMQFENAKCRRPEPPDGTKIYKSVEVRYRAIQSRTYYLQKSDRLADLSEEIRIIDNDLKNEVSTDFERREELSQEAERLSDLLLNRMEEPANTPGPSEWKALYNEVTQLLDALLVVRSGRPELSESFEFRHSVNPKLVKELDSELERLRSWLAKKVRTSEGVSERISERLQKPLTLATKQSHKKNVQQKLTYAAWWERKPLKSVRSVRKRKR